MKLTIREDSKNYACTVVKLPPKQKVEGLDRLVKVTVFGNDILTQKDADEEQLYLFFPAECRISQEYLSLNNEFRHTNLNSNDKAKPGFFEDTGRVKAIKFKGIISTGYMAPVNTLEEWYDSTDFKEGMEFTDIDGVNICKKYKIVHQQGAASGESRFNKKLKKFDKLVPNQFRFHIDTNPLARNLHHFANPRDIVCITDKWHGTSTVFSNVLINKKLDWKHKIAKWLGLDIVSTIYDHLYASRSVIKNQYINEGATAGYYNEDIWKIVHDEVKDKIEQGISLYGEIVGYLPSGKMIQKDYDYGCKTQNVKDYIPSEEHPEVKLDGLVTRNEHKFLVYRITYTKPDGNVIEFSWKQIKGYCEKYGLEYVKELFYGNIGTISPQRLDTYSTDVLFEDLSRLFLEKDCIYCVNKVPAEGVVVRIDGKDTFSAYKLKSRRFLEKETKQLDEEEKVGEINIEDHA